MSPEEIRRLAKAALAEDVGNGDVTTQAIVPPGTPARALMRSRERLVVAGTALAEAAFRELSTELTITRRIEDGSPSDPGTVLIEIEGDARPILTAERVALNFLQRLSGIATLTRQFVEAVQGTRTQIIDTRKTTPGWRQLEKYAVRCGGGRNHRFGLFDMILIKDNHLAAVRQPDAMAAAMRQARACYPQLKIEVEADTLEQVDQALAAGADLILLDNMNPVQLRLAVQKCRGQAQTEASGGVTLGSVRSIAETGVDFISVGALTHSARAVDIGLDFEL